MMDWSEHCIYCQAPLYRLGGGMLKCSRCRKKMSPRRIGKTLALIEAFAQDRNARETAVDLGLSYASVHRYFTTFRKTPMTNRKPSPPVKIIFRPACRTGNIIFRRTAAWNRRSRKSWPDCVSWMHRQRRQRSDGSYRMPLFIIFIT